MRLHAVFFCLFLSVIFACSQKESTSKQEGPFFGNGFHNGWADQESIVIWTRLTQWKEGNADGKKFISLTKDESDLLDENPTKEMIHGAQIPEGLSLDDMEGACPGSPGEVKLTYYPADQPDKKMELPWVAVNTDENYTYQWQLEALSADTEYKVVLEARRGSGSGRVRQG